MALYAHYPDKQFEPCPEGLHQAVCVDACALPDLSDYGKPQVRLTWQIAEVDPTTGLRFDVIKTFTDSMFKTATLRKDLEQWRARPFTEDEARRFDLESLLGANCLLQVTHAASKTTGNPYAKVTIILPLPKGTPRLAPLNFTRRVPKSRTTTASAAPTASLNAIMSAAAAIPDRPLEDTPLPVTEPLPESPVMPGDETDVDDVEFVFGANDTKEVQ